MSTQHTPTPWALRFDDDGVSICSLTADGKPDYYIAKECGGYALQTNDLQHAIRCVNAHDELVEALREARIFVGSIDSTGAKIALARIEIALAKAGAL